MRQDEITHPDYPYELEKLKSILSYLLTYLGSSRKKKVSIDKDLEYSIKHYNPDNVEQFHELTLNILTQTYLDRKIKDMDRSLGKPYFARIDFTADDTGATERLYIGKMTLFRQEDNELLITDWRAPVSSLYYEERLGRSAYDCEDGRITGELSLKRQYDINDGVLNGLMDVDITTNDEFLQAALGASKDRRLKDIVTTIQAEQNRVIRTGMFTNLIVQGAAGSGKTTIALHRIAYLLYNYEKKIKPQNIMIIAPNRFFLSYISDVLPDLGVEKIRQTTFEDFAAEYTGEHIKIKTSADILAASIEPNAQRQSSMNASRLKSSLRYKELIEKYVKAVIPKVLPDKSFVIEGAVVMDIREIKLSYLRDYSFIPALRRVEKLISVLELKLKGKKNAITEHIERAYEEKKERIKRRTPDSDERRQTIIALLDERDAKLKDLKKTFRTAIKDYVATFKMYTPLAYYRFLFERPSLLNSLAAGIFTESEVAILSAEQEMTTDDLAPLIYIHYRMLGDEAENLTQRKVSASGLIDLAPPGKRSAPKALPGYYIPPPEPIKLVVIDEAQDFSLFQLWAMREVCKDAYFSILGDINQGIYSFRGIEKWDGAFALYKGKNPAYATLRQSYRTTVEIMDFANGVIDKLSGRLPKAQPVIRHGPEVSVAEYGSLEHAAAAIDAKRKTMAESGYRSFAIICKTMAECEELGKLFGGEVPVVTGKELDYEGGCLLVPAYLVKGLEFDVCCVANASAERFRDNELDIKLLYIAMTRALHELMICSVGPKTPLLPERGERGSGGCEKDGI